MEASFGTILILVAAGFVSSTVWLLFYLRQDTHPEPKKLIITVFLLGFVLAPLAVVAQHLFVEIARHFNPGFASGSSLMFFLFAAGIEEYVKYLAIRFVILDDPEFDEPIDAMIYMIIAALGFAAIENIIVLFRTMEEIQQTSAVNGVQTLLLIWILRFFGATLLHVLSSAIIGYFLGLAWFYNQHSKKLLLMGFVIATTFHFSFNLVLVNLNSRDALFASSGIIVVMIIFTSILFHQIRKRQELHEKIEAYPKLYQLHHL